MDPNPDSGTRSAVGASASSGLRPARNCRPPLLRFQTLERPVWGRVYALIYGGVFVGLLAVTVSLVPNVRTHMGTHQQLGLPPCGFVVMTGYPCPTCGMTTAFAAVLRGQWGTAVRASLAGTVFAVLLIALSLNAAYAVLAGRYLTLDFYRVRADWLVWGAVALILVSWGANVLWGRLDGTLPVPMADAFDQASGP